MNDPVATGTLARWDDKHVDRLKELAPTKSCAVIAAWLNIQFSTAYTRNAVIGKLNRLGLSKPVTAPQDSRVGPRKPRKPRKQYAPSGFDRTAPPPLATLPLPMNEPNPAAAMPFEALTSRMCRWPYGDGPFLFCGAEIAGHPSYCPCHADVAGRPAPPMTASAMRWMGGRAA
jgi:GcrA cell cycle regulator